MFNRESKPPVGESDFSFLQEDQAAAEIMERFLTKAVDRAYRRDGDVRNKENVNKQREEELFKINAFQKILYDESMFPGIGGKELLQRGE